MIDTDVPSIPVMSPCSIRWQRKMTLIDSWPPLVFTTASLHPGIIRCRLVNSTNISASKKNNCSKEICPHISVVLMATVLELGRLSIITHRCLWHLQDMCTSITSYVWSDLYHFHNDFAEHNMEKFTPLFQQNTTLLQFYMLGFVVYFLWLCVLRITN